MAKKKVMEAQEESLEIIEAKSVVVYHRYRCPVCGREEVMPDEAEHLCGGKCNYREKMEVYSKNFNGEQHEKDNQELE